MRPAVVLQELVMSPSMPPNAQPRAFSIIELLVVILILGVVMAILFPAISGARSNARNAASLSLMNNLSTAANQFATDKRTEPGYFNTTDMAHIDNGTLAQPGRGFSAMQNMLLDLLGGVTDQSATVDGFNIISVGPRASGAVKVDTRLLGTAPSATTKSYFKPDGTYLAVQDTPEKQPGSVPAHRLLPTIIDAFGSPVLAWVQNKSPAVNFAGINSGDPQTAQFYWATNATFLRSTQLGKLGKDQTVVGNFNRPGSLIGAGLDPLEVSISLEAILGNPAFPAKLVSGNPVAKPGAPRGPIIFHSAGPNGIFVGSNERGGNAARGVAPFNSIKYSSTDDAMRQGEFDDVILRAGN